MLTGDFFCDLEIDKFHVGSTTTASVGSMTIEAGSWGSSGSEIEGSVEAFDAEAFLAGAQITAASIGPVTTTTGSFDGTLILTDPDSSAVPVFTVNSDFTGSVVSASSIKRLVIKGDFTGTLEAPSIGSITAYAFLGSKDLLGAPTTQIMATAGALGTITATAGVVKDYEIVTDQAFKGFKVKLANLTADTIGLDNVKITAASIGAITVSLSAKATAAAGVDLTGIRNSSFVTTATGTTKATAGTIGNVSVTLTGGLNGGDANGLEDVTFDALVGTHVTGEAPEIMWEDSHGHFQFETEAEARQAIADPYYQQFLPEVDWAKTVVRQVRIFRPYCSDPAAIWAVVDKATTAHGPDLHECARQAVRHMIDHLVRERGLSREEAYILCSVAVDLRISEIVDAPNWIVSAFLPEDVFVG